MSLHSDTIRRAIDMAPAGAWGVGVSGGADSVAMLWLLRRRSDLRLHVIHLDHETRGGASAEDARFVRDLAIAWGTPLTSARLSEIEREAGTVPPANRAARFRAGRLALFARAAREHGLSGVILAHHADDQAETVLLRLLRGAPAEGLCGMMAETTLRGLRVLRPLLEVRRSELRDLLLAAGVAWREDESNRSMAYARNRVRAVLAGRPELVSPLLEIARRAAALRGWLERATPALEETFVASALADLPDVVARRAARRWLAGRGCPADEATSAVAARLIEMVRDAGTPARQQFPGGMTVVRGGRAGGRRISVTWPAATPRGGSSPGHSR